MMVKLSKRRFERFVENRAKAISLTDGDIAAIDRAAKQFERGEGIPFRRFAKEAKKKYGLK
jgi:hypothetical protein